MECSPNAKYLLSIIEHCDESGKGMERYQDDIARIRQLLRDHAKGMSITDIAEAINSSRNSVAKYLDILQIQGSVDAYKVGTSKLYFLSSRLPSHAIRDVCTRPFLLIDKEEIVTETNTLMAEMLGIPRDRIKGRDFESLPLKIHEKGEPKQILYGTLRGSSYRVRGEVLPQNGKQKEVVLLLEPIVFENGRPGAALIIESPELHTVTTDITGAFSDILALLDDEIEYVVRHTPDGIIRFVNETYCLAAGKMKEDMMNQPFRPLVSSEDVQRIQEHFAGLSLKNSVDWIEFKAVMAGGEVRWQRWKNRALFDDRGGLTGYQSCGLDITDLMVLKQELAAEGEKSNEIVMKRTEELRATNRQLYAELSNRDKVEQRLLKAQYLLDHSPDSIILTSRNGQIQFVNKRFEDLLGYRENELFDLPLSAIVTGGFADPASDFFNRLKGYNPLKTRANLRMKDGKEIPVEILFLALRYHGEDLICCYARDQPRSESVPEKTLPLSSENSTSEGS